MPIAATTAAPANTRPITGGRRSVALSRRASRAGVACIVDRTHPMLEHVGIDLRGREVGMTEHHLDGAEIGAAFEQVRGERMPQRMRAEPGLQPGLAGVGLENLPEAHACEA